MDNVAKYYYNHYANSWWPTIISLLLTIIIVIRTYVGGPKCSSDARMIGKIVLITGGSGGLGIAVAKQLACRGAHIILTCRNEIKGNNALRDIRKSYPNAKLNLKLLDVSSLSNVQKFVKEIKQEYTKLDVLINNAGIIFHPYERTSEGFELTMVTNYLGPFTLTHLLLPLLNKSDNGRIVNVSALAHFGAEININDLNSRREFKEKEIFGQTKLAMILFTRHLAKLLKSTKITVNAVNPGLVRNTDHLRNSIMETSFPTKISVWPWMWLFMKNPMQGSQTILYAVVEPTLELITGKYFSDCTIKNPSDAACNDQLANNLYTASCEICNFNGERMIQKLLQQPVKD